MKKLFARILIMVMVTSILTMSNGFLFETTDVYAAVRLNKKSTNIIKGQKVKLKILGTKKKAKWSSSKKSVAVVNNKGVVTAKKKGKAKITAKIGKKKYVCKVTVKNPSLPKKGTYSVNPNGPYEEANYYVTIKSISKTKIKFDICKLGQYASPIYETGTITTSIKKDKTGTNTFKWTDSWENKGKGRIKFISKKKIMLTMTETYRAPSNRSSLGCKNMKLIYEE